MLGFDRGGAYAQAFLVPARRRCHPPVRPAVVPVMLPVITTITCRRTRQIAWAEETVQIKDYGEAGHHPLGHGKVALHILTSNSGACPAEILAWLKSRWREENFLKIQRELRDRQDLRLPRRASQ